MYLQLKQLGFDIQHSRWVMWNRRRMWKMDLVEEGDEKNFLKFMNYKFMRN